MPVRTKIQVCYTVLTILLTQLIIPIKYYHWQIINNSLNMLTIKNARTDDT